MSIIKNVAIAGASGNIGAPILKALIASGKFNVTVISRKGSSSSFPEGVKVTQVDYESFDSLKSAFQGQDAAISTLASIAVKVQTGLIDAAVAAGVKRFLPSEFGSDIDNPKTRLLPVFKDKVIVQEHLQEERSPVIQGDGDVKFSATTLDAVGKAVVNVLLDTESTVNRAVYIRDVYISQNQLLELGKELTPGENWTPTSAKISDGIAKSEEQLRSGNISFHTWLPYLYRAIFEEEYGPKNVKWDSELLQVEPLDNAAIKQVLQSGLKA